MPESGWHFLSSQHKDHRWLGPEGLPAAAQGPTWALRSRQSDQGPAYPTPRPAHSRKHSSLAPGPKGWTSNPPSWDQCGSWSRGAQKSQQRKPPAPLLHLCLVTCPGPVSALSQVHPHCALISPSVPAGPSEQAGGPGKHSLPCKPGLLIGKSRVEPENLHFQQAPR